MQRHLLAILMFLAAPAGALHAQVSVEHIFRPGALSLSVLAGGAAFSPFMRADVSPEILPLEAQRRLSAHTAAALGAELMLWLTPSVGVRLHASGTRTRFDVQQEIPETDIPGERGPENGEWKRLSVWLLDASALLRPHFTLGRMAPFAILGAGVASYRPQGGGEMPPEAAAAFSGGARTIPAAVVGVGAAVPLQRRNLALSFALTDHITRTPVRDVPRESLRSAETGEEGSDGVSLTSNVRLLVGLTIPLRRVQ